MQLIKLKTLLIGLMTLVISLQTFAYSETKNLYYPTGEVKEAQEYVNGNISKATTYHKNGEIEGVRNF